MVVSSHTVANTLIKLAEQADKRLTNMQLQKLVFLSHGYTLALLDHPPYYHDTYAWQWGPVVRELYKSLQKYGSGEVTAPLSAAENESLAVDSQEMEIVKAVWEVYGKFTGGQLSTLTHKPNTPWDITWKSNPFGVIPQQLITDHYKSLI